jgi:hypothetical protein
MFWQGTGGKKWVKKVQQEWSILEKNLPGLLLLNTSTKNNQGQLYYDLLMFLSLHL